MPSRHCLSDRESRCWCLSEGLYSDFGLERKGNRVYLYMSVDLLTQSMDAMTRYLGLWSQNLEVKERLPYGHHVHEFIASMNDD